MGNLIRLFLRYPFSIILIPVLLGLSILWGVWLNKTVNHLGITESMLGFIVTHILGILVWIYLVKAGRFRNARFMFRILGFVALFLLMLWLIAYIITLLLHGEETTAVWFGCGEGVAVILDLLLFVAFWIEEHLMR